MSSETPEVTLCRFDSITGGTTQYVCYDYERCCPQGCCLTYSYKYLNSWYFWLALLVLLSLFYCASKYCKRVDTEQHRRVRHLRRFEPDGDSYLNQLLQRYRPNSEPSVSQASEHSTKELPPKYAEALSMPKPPPSVRIDLQQVPTYEEAVKEEK